MFYILCNVNKMVGLMEHDTMHLEYEYLRKTSLHRIIRYLLMYEACPESKDTSRVGR